MTKGEMLLIASLSQVTAVSEDLTALEAPLPAGSFDVVESQDPNSCVISVTISVILEELT